MSGQLVAVLVALAAAAVGAVTSWSWLTAGGLTAAVWWLALDAADEPAIRGALTFLSVPVILAVVLVAA